MTQSAVEGPTTTGEERNRVSSKDTPGRQSRWKMARIAAKAASEHVFCYSAIRTSAILLFGRTSIISKSLCSMSIFCYSAICYSAICYSAISLFCYSAILLPQIWKNYVECALSAILLFCYLLSAILLFCYSDAFRCGRRHFPRWRTTTPSSSFRMMKSPALPPHMVCIFLCFLWSSCVPPHNSIASFRR
jgi:hypothetical protein